MASERAARLAENEAVFRIANERMAGWDERQASEEIELYFCECAHADCREKVALTKGDYERVRSDPCHFLAVAGHETPDVESVVEHHDNWVMVEKEGDVANIVKGSDPRS